MLTRIECLQFGEKKDSQNFVLAVHGADLMEADQRTMLLTDVGYDAGDIAAHVAGCAECQIVIQKCGGVQFATFAAV